MGKSGGETENSVPPAGFVVYRGAGLSKCIYGILICEYKEVLSFGILNKKNPISAFCQPNLYKKYFYGFRRITPQPIFSPELPEGCVTKSSGIRWMMTERPRISGMPKRLS